MINSRSKYWSAIYSRASSRVWLTSSMKSWCRSMRTRPGSMRRIRWCRKVMSTIRSQRIGTGSVVMVRINKICHRNLNNSVGTLMAQHSVKLAKITRRRRMIMQRLMRQMAQIHRNSNHLEIPLILTKTEMLMRHRGNHWQKMTKKMVAMPRDPYHLRKDK